MNERFSIGARLVTGVLEFFAFAMETTLPDGTRVIDDRAVRSKLATWRRKIAPTAQIYRIPFGVGACRMARKRPGPRIRSGSRRSMSQEAIFRPWRCRPGGEGANDRGPAGKLAEILLEAAGKRIGGTERTIMRNIIAERVLGPPPDIASTRTWAFDRDPDTGR